MKKLLMLFLLIAFVSINANSQTNYKLLLTNGETCTFKMSDSQTHVFGTLTDTSGNKKHVPVYKVNPTNETVRINESLNKFATLELCSFGTAVVTAGVSFLFCKASVNSQNEHLCENYRKAAVATGILGTIATAALSISGYIELFNRNVYFSDGKIGFYIPF